MVIVNKKEIDDMFIEFVYNLKSEFPEFFNKRIKEVLFKLIVKFFGKYIHKIINHDKNYLKFNKVYFLKNLYKNMIAISYLKSKNIIESSSIVDIGCGAATSSIAYLLINKLDGKDVANIKIKLIDNSTGQLNLAKRILTTLGINEYEFKKENVSIENIIFNELVFFSYFVCEQEADFIPKLSNNINNFRNGFICIDYKKNINKLKYYLKNKCTMVSWNLTIEMNKEVSEILKEELIEIHGCYCKPKKNS